MDMSKEKAPTERRGSVVERVINGIISSIIEGELRPGDQLPTEPELCKKYDAGRNSVREAIKQLQAYGVVYIRRADGTYISDSYDQKMLDPMLYNIILHQNDWKDFVTLRAVIDIGTLELALTLPNVTDCVPDLERIVDAMEEEMHSPAPSKERIMELDTQFHDTIANTVHNPQVSSVTEYITRLTVPSRMNTVERVLRQEGEVDNFIALHQQIVDLIARRDAAHIVEVVQDHYVYWENDIVPGAGPASKEVPG